MTALTPRPTSDATERPAAPGGPRYDIQGLRALAVLAVILDHLASWPSGGFVGVDVFFVVSGFLISGQLLRNAEGGGISFAEFYRRRARRILPIAVLVIAVTIPATYLLTNPAFGHDVLVDGIWALFFMSNWHFAAIGTDYFAGGATSPLQHYWSLAVEEQFYIFWPWLIIAFLGLRGRTRRGPSARRNLGIAMVIVCAATFAFACWQTASSPTNAYFSTLSRTWELGVGALLAFHWERLSKIPDWMRPILSWLGAVGIFVAMFVISEDTPFPGPWAAVPVVATAAIIAAGTFSERGRQQRFMGLFTNPVSGYIGDISYSLYLWHFPIIILLPAVIQEKNWGFYLTAVLLIAALSIASFELIEDPIHHSEWLEPKRHHGGLNWLILSDRLRVTAVGLFGVVVVAFSIYVLVSKPAPPPVTVQDLSLTAPATSGTSESPAAGGAFSPAVAVEQERISRALAAGSFPKLDPAVEDLGFDKWVEDFRNLGFCDYGVDASNAASCVFGDVSGPKTAVVLGDSFAMAWLPGIVDALAAKGYRVQQLTMAECPVWAVDVTHSDGSPFPECKTHRDDAATWVAANKPDLIIAATADTTIARMAGAGGGIGGTVTPALTSALQQLHAGKQSRVVVLGPPPASGDLQSCDTRFASPHDCELGITDDWRAVRDAEKAAAKTAGADYIDVADWFCSAETQECPAFIGNTPVRVDGHHLTLTFSKQISPLLAPALTG